MPTTITLKETPPPAKHTQFPCLRKTKDDLLIVLFFNRNCGTFVGGKDKETYKIGQFSENWLDCDDEDNWVKIAGEVVIKCEV